MFVLLGSAVYGQNAFSPYIFNPGKRNVNPVFLVIKSEQSMLLLDFQKEQFPKQIEKYRVTTGRIAGNKQREGDLKTPEGVYRIVRQIEDEQLPPKYGPRAYILDYPNFTDRFLGRTGSNIWIHGRDEAIEDFLTEGCVSLENGLVEELRKFVVNGKSFTVIVDSVKRADSAAYMELGTIWQQRILQWGEFWERGELDDYFAYYHHRFRDAGATLQAFKSRKASLEKRYAWKDIELDSLFILSSDSEAVAIFDQTYTSPSFSSRGEKTLTFLQAKDGWKIIREMYRDYHQRIEFRNELEAFVEQWRRAWESKDIERYMAFYHSEFFSDSMDYDGWKQDKLHKFISSSQIRVETGNLNIQSDEPFTWRLRFFQKYYTESYQDAGYKSLLINGRPGKILILQENWTPTYE
jgi:murein L,D-transpeptidase YafK